MDRLHWYEGDRWANELLIFENNKPHWHGELYSFPLDEVLFQLLKRSELDSIWDVPQNLEALIGAYNSTHDDAAISSALLIETGAIDQMFGRWNLTGHIMQGHLPLVETSKQKQLLDFLLWLQDQLPIDCSAVYVENVESVLEQLRQIYPELPTKEWFIKKHIFAEDMHHLYTFEHLDKDAVSRAFARFFMLQETRQDKERWAEIAHQLCAPAETLDFLPKEKRIDAANILAQRLRSAKIPSAEDKNRCIQWYSLLERRDLSNKSKINYRLLRDGASVDNVLFAENSKDLFFRLNFHQFIWWNLELKAAINNIDDLEKDLQINTLKILGDAHALGLLAFTPLPAAACIQLLDFEPTRFLALQTLVLTNREAEHDGNPTVGNCILSWIHFAIERLPETGTAPLTHLLMYLAEYAYRPGNAWQFDKQLLNAILNELTNFYSPKQSFLIAMARQLIGRLETTKGIDWSRIFQLLCGWSEILFEKVPPMQRESSELFACIYNALACGANQLLNIHCCLASKYVPAEVFNGGYWREIYNTCNTYDKNKLRDCVLCWYRKDVPERIQDKFDAKYQFRLGISFLAALVRGDVKDKQALAKLIDLLCYTLCRQNGLLALSSYPIDGIENVVTHAAATLQWEQLSDTELWTNLCALDIPELTLILHGVQDKKLYTELEKEIVAKSSSAVAFFEQIGWDSFITYIVNEKISSLYTLCEQKLQEHIAWGKQRKLNHTAFERDKLLLGQIWLLQGEYKKVLEQGHPVTIAILYLEPGEYQDIDKAVNCWRELAQNSKEPMYAINYMCSLLYQLERQCKAISGKISHTINQIEALRHKIEEEQLPNWSEDATLHYASLLVWYWEIQCTDENAALLHAQEITGVAPEKLQSHKIGSEQTPPPIQLPPQASTSDELLSRMLKDFRCYTLEAKARLYFNARGCHTPEDCASSIVFLELFRTLYHFSNYSDKLLINGKLYEDHCTQLVREMMNLNGSEWWALAANDQQQSGSTGNVSRSGLPGSAEIDLIVKNESYTCLDIEALVLDTLDRKEINDHFIKLIGDSQNSNSMALLIYGDSNEPGALWQDLKSYIYNEFPRIAQSVGVELSSFDAYTQSPYYVKGLYTNMDKLTNCSLISEVKNEYERTHPLLVIYIDVSKRNDTQRSAIARGHEPTS